MFIACNNSTDTSSIPDDSFLVDVRTPEEFLNGSVPNAVNIPLSELPNRLDEFSGKSTIVVFCRSGNRSGKAKKILTDKGIKNVINGGSWKNVIDSLKEFSES